jgi:formate dehydrogenase alpha subunit
MPSKVNKETVLAYTQSGFQTDVGTRYDWRSFHTESSDMLTLQLTQSLFHSGKFSTKAKGLMQIQDSGALSVNPQDAQQLGIQQGDQVTVSNSLGQVQVKARLLDRVPMGVAFFPEHFDEEIRSLFSIEIDPSTGVPYGKLTQVRVAPVSAL